jgi:hypothetical protein
MAGDKEQLLSMGFDPARVDCKLAGPRLSGKELITRVTQGNAQFRTSGQLTPVSGMGKADDQAAMDHLLSNSEKPIPEADDDDEEAVQSLESGEEAKVPIPLLRDQL